MLGQDGEGVLPEDLDDERGGGGTDAVDQTAAEVALDPEEGGGDFQFAGFAAELPPIGPVFDPFAGENGLFAGGQLRQGADHRQLTASGTDGHDGPAVFRIAENGAKDGRFELLH